MATVFFDRFESEHAEMAGESRKKRMFSKVANRLCVSYCKAGDVDGTIGDEYPYWASAGQRLLGSGDTEAPPDFTLSLGRL